MALKYKRRISRVSVLIVVAMLCAACAGHPRPGAPTIAATVDPSVDGRDGLEPAWDCGPFDCSLVYFDDEFVVTSTGTSISIDDPDNIRFDGLKIGPGVSVDRAGDTLFIFESTDDGPDRLHEWSISGGHIIHGLLPEEGFRPPSIGISADGTAYLGINDSVWFARDTPLQSWNLLTQARTDRGGRWLGWVDIAPGATHWIYHEVDSGYLLVGNDNGEWFTATIDGVPIGEDPFRLGDGDSHVEVTGLDNETLIVDTYEGQISINLAET